MSTGRNIQWTWNKHGSSQQRDPAFGQAQDYECMLFFPVLELMSDLQCELGHTQEILSSYHHLPGAVRAQWF